MGDTTHGLSSEKTLQSIFVVVHMSLIGVRLISWFVCYEIGPPGEVGLGHTSEEPFTRRDRLAPLTTKGDDERVLTFV